MAFREEKNNAMFDKVDGMLCTMEKLYSEEFSSARVSGCARSGTSKEPPFSLSLGDQLNKLAG